jgi:hypothetical protein
MHRERFLGVLAGAALLLLGGITSMALGGLVPGKGNPKTACYVEYDVEGVTNPSPVVTNGGGRVLCTDGEPCDAGTGHQCGDHVCVLRIRPCINQTDPNTPSCTPPAGLQRLTINPKKVDIGVPQLLQGPVCGAFVDLPIKIPTKKDGTPKKPFYGTVTLKSSAKGVKGTKPSKGTDSIQLRCILRTTPCPSPSTTSSTAPTTPTTPTSSTTTTSSTTASSTTTSSQPGAGFCGDGKIEPSEECDGTNLNGATCETAGFAKGTLGCAPGCTFDTSGCVRSTVPGCGNGVREGVEGCDGADIGGATCASLGFNGGGTLGCTTGCAFDTSGCACNVATTTETTSTSTTTTETTSTSTTTTPVCTAGDLCSQPDCVARMTVSGGLRCTHNCQFAPNCTLDQDCPCIGCFCTHFAPGTNVCCFPCS